MNNKIISIIAAGGLSLMAGAALAQSAQANQQQPPPYTSSTPQSTQNGTNPTTANGMNDNGMNGNGNADMNGSAATGNGMNSGGNGQTPPAFSSLDTHGNGYLTQQDAAQNSWLGMHWAQCDADHDGKVTRMEYEACSQH